jgi:uncharacterized protein (TIGR02646 family)
MRRGQGRAAVKRLRRGPTPPDLSRYQHGQDKWDHTITCRPALYAALNAMQGGACAYCERSIAREDQRHIEHFRCRHDYPQHTFDWHNLFLSCGCSSSCGQFKDSKRARPYDPAHLIDPCQEDPDDLLRFRENGQVEPRCGLSPANQRRAEETIRVLNLNLPALRSQRQQQLNTYRSTEPDILAALEAWPPHERQQYIDAEIKAAETAPFSAIIRQFWTV